MRKVIFLVLLVLLSTGTGAQNNVAPAYEINSDTAANIKLDDTHWQMLEDPEGKWTIENISRAPLSNKFHANTTKPKGIFKVDYSIKAYWLRYRFINKMDHVVSITIPKNVTQADFYASGSDEKWNHKLTGTLVPWSKRDVFKRITAVTYTIEPQKELLIYERDYSDYVFNMPDSFEINFAFTDKILRDYDDNDSSMLLSFLFGIFLLAALFNLYFFLIIRRRVYLFFSLTILGNGMMHFLSDNNSFLSENITVKWYLVSGGAFIYFFFLVHFVRYFFETFKYFPRWDKYLIALSFNFSICQILVGKGIIPYEYSDVLGPGIEMLSILITFVMFSRSHVKSVRLAIVAVLPVICIMCIPSIFSSFKLLNMHAGIPIPIFLQWIWVNNRYAILEQVGLVWALIFFSWSLFQRYQQLEKQIAHETLAKERIAKEKEIERSELIELQKIELEKTVEERTTELKQSLEDLKSTQSQLIQSEKMASLGELTVGIAHEIQNPLNFVNNFSEVNTELIDELGEQMNKGNFTDAKAIAKDIQENEQKINFHGKRADAIVKGMLQHSRTSTGQKEPTDINALADEYLRLSYHGLRARDKNFNAGMKTDFDSTTGNINLIPQDIGRVLLNLYNNAFYVAAEKKKIKREGYEPTVSVSTKKIDGKVEIRVKDNGNGIPKNIVDKIFQPFFTTKPTGQGIGLGLSLSYDIVKAHGGEIKVETKEGEYSEFIVLLPV